MFFRYSLLAVALTIGGCTSPASFIQDEATAVAGISTQYASFEQFKASIKSNASYARLAYASMSRNGYLSKVTKTRDLGNVCLKYAVEDSVRQKKIRDRFNDLKKLLDAAAQFLCSTPDAKTEKDGGSCPNSNGKTTDAKVLEFFNSFAAVAAMTPAQVEAAAANAAAQTGVAVYELVYNSRQYAKALAFLADRKTQRKFKVAVDLLERDLVNADDDLRNNMQTWTACRRARLETAVEHMRWSDGSSQLVFSNEAVDFQKELDLVQDHYSNYTSTFLPDTQSALAKLESAFAKLPAAGFDPTALDAVVKDISSVKDDIDKLNASNSKAS